MNGGITISLSGFEGYRLSVRLKKAQGSSCLVAHLSSIPVFFLGRTISIPEKIENFSGKEALYSLLLEKRIGGRKLTESTAEISTRPEMPDMIAPVETLNGLISKNCEQQCLLRAKESEAKEIYKKYLSIEVLESDNLAITFSGTKALGGRLNNLQAGININEFDKANASGAVYSQAQRDLVKLYFPYLSDDESDTMADQAKIILESVRDNVESQLYDPDNMDRMYIDYEEEEALMELIDKDISPSTECTEKEYVNRCKRKIFESNIWRYAVFDSHGTINIDDTLKAVIKDKEGAGCTIDENAKKTLEQLIFVLNQRHVNPYGFRFMCLKRSVMISMGLRKPTEYFNQMTRAEFKDFHEEYKKKVLASCLKQIPLSPIANHAVSEVMESNLLPKINIPLKSDDSDKNNISTAKKDIKSIEQDLSKGAEKILRAYAKALVDKAVESVGNHRPISDDMANNVGPRYELVDKDESHDFLLKVRDSLCDPSNNTWVRWDEESHSFVEGCSMKEAEESYAKHKEQLCCFDEVLFRNDTRTQSYKRDQNDGVTKEDKAIKPLLTFDYNRLVNEINALSIENIEQSKITIKKVNELFSDRLIKVNKHIEVLLARISWIERKRSREFRPYVVNLTDPNRSLVLATKLGDVYSEAQSPAMDSLEEMYVPEMEKVLCSLFRKGYDMIKEQFEKDRSRFDSALKAAGMKGIDDINNKALLVTLNKFKFSDYEKKVNQCAHEISNAIFCQMGDLPYNPKDLEGITMDTFGTRSSEVWLGKDEGKQWLAQYPESERLKIQAKIHLLYFVNSVCRLAYKMRSTDPVMVLKWLEGNDEIEGKKYKELNKEWFQYVDVSLEDVVNYTVWPSAYLMSGGPVMAKGTIGRL